eukprot:gene11143-18578_t
MQPGAAVTVVKEFSASHCHLEDTKLHRGEHGTVSCVISDRDADGDARADIRFDGHPNKALLVYRRQFGNLRVDGGGGGAATESVHTGEWRKQELTCYHCSSMMCPDGAFCRHPGGEIKEDHWSCCGAVRRDAPPCGRRETERGGGAAAQELIGTTVIVTEDVKCNNGKLLRCGERGEVSNFDSDDGAAWVRVNDVVFVVPSNDIAKLRVDGR